MFGEQAYHSEIICLISLIMSFISLSCIKPTIALIDLSLYSSFRNSTRFLTEARLCETSKINLPFTSHLPNKFVCSRISLKFIGLSVISLYAAMEHAADSLLRLLDFISSSKKSIPSCRVLEFNSFTFFITLKGISLAPIIITLPSLKIADFSSPISSLVFPSHF